MVLTVADAALHQGEAQDTYQVLVVVTHDWASLTCCPSDSYVDGPAEARGWTQMVAVLGLSEAPSPERPE